LRIFVGRGAAAAGGEARCDELALSQQPGRGKRRRTRDNVMGKWSARARAFDAAVTQHRARARERDLARAGSVWTDKRSNEEREREREGGREKFY
jgi:hypothetical protein